MSQFIAFSAIPAGLAHNPLIGRSEPLSKSSPVAQLYFSDSALVYWVPSADDWFMDAMELMSSGVPLISTNLGAFIVALMDAHARIAVWYSDEWDDLPMAVTRQGFLDVIQQQIMEPPGEVWALYDEKPQGGS